MKKILLAAVNAKYIHSNLAVYSLKAYAEKCMDTYGVRGVEIETAEYTINQQPGDILKQIYQRAPDVLCFSCYIWNIGYVESVVKEVYKLLPGTEIWLGGPEVSYDGEEVLFRLFQVKGIMKGEGEETFAELCRIYADIEETGSCEMEERLERTSGITFRRIDGSIAVNGWREPMNLDRIPFVYKDVDDFEHKIIYYETSRGCPFSCSYCLSSIDKRLRFRSFELVKEELAFFIACRVPQVKFVDRTFNCSHAHALRVWRYIAEHDNGVTNFHFEVAADLLNEEELALIETMRPGLIQLEIGVQSVNPDTIREIKRRMNYDQVRNNVSRIKRGGNIHQHLDLIAGLPYEDIESFAHSFDEVYALRPNQLQLGFLKVLKGSYMEENKESYGLVFQSSPPYEVLYTTWLSYGDILKLKGIEEMVEVYYNSGQFFHTLEELERGYVSAFRMYAELSEYYESRRYSEVQHKRSARYEILLEFVKTYFPEKTGAVRELLTYDYYLRENAKTRPEFAGEYKVEKEFLKRFYEREAKEHRYLPGYQAYDKNQMRKMTHIEYFPILKKMLLFDYMCRNPLNQEARTCMIERGLNQ